ncbi:MAG TPA: hypothetical protein VF432_10870 [Thermoanaerobaculia bacterium]
MRTDFLIDESPSCGILDRTGAHGRTKAGGRKVLFVTYQGAPCYTSRSYVPNDDDGTDANDELDLVALPLIVLPQFE